MLTLISLYQYPSKQPERRKRCFLGKISSGDWWLGKILKFLEKVVEHNFTVV